MAARRTLVAGSAGAAKSPLGSGRPDHSTAEYEGGATRRHLSRRQGAATGQSGGVAVAADGPDGAGLSGLSEFRGLHRMEQLADLFDHGGLSRHPHRRRSPDVAALGADRAT